MTTLRVMAVLFALTGAAGVCYCGFQFMLTLAYGLWGHAILYGLGLAFSGLLLAATPWLWRQASS